MTKHVLGNEYEIREYSFASILVELKTGFQSLLTPQETNNFLFSYPMHKKRIPQKDESQWITNNDL